MDLQKRIAFVIFLSLHLCSITTAADIDPNYEYNECGKRGNYTQNSTYSNNLNTLLSSLSNNVNQYGFYNGSVGQEPERARAIVLCRGDVELNVCRSCVSDNAPRIIELCPNQKEAFRWYNICSIYYSDESIIGSLQTSPETVQYSENIVQNPAQFTQDLTSLVDRLTRQAVNGGPFLKYAADNTTGSGLQTIFSYVQCTPDLSVKNCNDCLITAFTQWSGSQGNDRIGARVLCPSCFFRYEITPFFGNSLIKKPPSTPSPPSPESGKNGNKSRKVISIVISIGAGVIVLAICIFILRRKRQRRKGNNYGDIEGSSSIDEISVVESLQYDFITIKNATDNFCEENKIGEGGFGAVYKGKLPNGWEVAVKRLSENSRQGNQEFKNAVVLVAKLQHRNLVRLLGFCLEGKEMLLIYEFVPNGGLDNILFDPVKRGYLDWGRRFKIIESIARGLVYLHEDSRLRIIHRDLKTSNILLDADLNPKIADFGMARLFTLEETQGSTSRIVGTYGYMAPEYAWHGLFSIRSDVYSFGVLVLEIISGQKNTTFQNRESMRDLLSYAWTNWKRGAASNVIDPMLTSTSSPVHEITKCIHIALLCVQQNVADRPTMAEVLQMFSNLTMTLPIPLAPGFFIHSSTSSESTSQLSRNEMSISEQYPR